MDTTQPAKKSIGQKVWVTVRFVLFGMIGLYGLFFFTIAFFCQFLGAGCEGIINPWLLLAIGCASPLMILYGVGEWGRWAYIWVPLSLPFSLWFMMSSHLFPYDKEFPVIGVAVAMITTYAIVRMYYRRQNENTHPNDNADQLEQSSEPSKNSSEE
jgi:hypothetical protein